MFCQLLIYFILSKKTNIGVIICNNFSVYVFYIYIYKKVEYFGEPSTSTVLQMYIFQGRQTSYAMELDRIAGLIIASDSRDQAFKIKKTKKKLIPS